MRLPTSAPGQATRDRSRGRDHLDGRVRATRLGDCEQSLGIGVVVLGAWCFSGHLGICLLIQVVVKGPSRCRCTGRRRSGFDRERGNAGETAPPKEAHESQRHQRSNGLRHKGTTRYQRSKRRVDRLHTAGVTGSIPVSPTNGGPGFRGLPSFPELSWVTWGPRRRWGRWLLSDLAFPDGGPIGTVSRTGGR